jgi:hypothetical protein
MENFSNLHVCEGYVGGRGYHAGCFHTIVIYGTERTRSFENTGQSWSRQDFVRSGAIYPYVKLIKFFNDQLQNSREDCNCFFTDTSYLNSFNKIFW